jgi:ERI1 exoribonuclease 3
LSFFLLFNFTFDLKKEIIEFPVLKVNTKTFEIEDTFHSYVEPKIHKKLTQFCTELTGITQNMVDNQPSIELTLKVNLK